MLNSTKYSWWHLLGLQQQMGRGSKEEEKVYQVSTYTLAEKIQFVSKKNYSFFYQKQQNKVQNEEMI